MKLSTRGRYGTRVAYGTMARHYGQGPLPLRTSQSSQQIPTLQYLERLMGR
jgi:DNA-binding IscR family transcriptional regulator